MVLQLECQAMTNPEYEHGLNLKEILPEFPGWIWKYYVDSFKPVASMRFRREDNEKISEAWKKLEYKPASEWREFLNTVAISRFVE